MTPPLEIVIMKPLMIKLTNQQIIKKSQNMRVSYIKVNNYIIALNIFEFTHNHILPFIIQKMNLLHINYYAKLK
jgi:hypothetical protein